MKRSHNRLARAILHAHLSLSAYVRPALQPLALAGRMESRMAIDAYSTSSPWRIIVEAGTNDVSEQLGARLRRTSMI